MPDRKERHISRWSYMALGLCIILALLHSRSDKGFFWDVERLASDREQAASTGTRVVMVDIGLAWSLAHTWSSTQRQAQCKQLAQLLLRVLQHQPKAIGLDVLLSRRGRAYNTCTPRKGEASPLLDALRAASDRLVLPMQLVLPPYVSWHGSRWSSTNGKEYLLHQKIHLAWPVASVRHTKARIGVANLLREGTTFRRALTWLPFPTTGHSHHGDIALFEKPQELPQKLPSFAMELARAARPGLSYPDKAQKLPIQWRYLGEPLSAKGLHKGQSPQLKDAVVLIGAFYRPQLEDIFVTPVGWRAGLHVQAHITDTLLNGSPTRAIPIWAALLLLSLLSLLACGMGRLAFHPSWLLLSLIAVAALVWIGAGVWYQYSGEVSPLIGCWLVMGCSFATGIARQLQDQRKAVSQLTSQTRAIYEAIHTSTEDSDETAIAYMRDAFPQPLAYYSAYLNRATQPTLQMLFAIDLFQLALIYVDSLAIAMLFETADETRGKVRGVLKGQKILGKNPSIGVWWGFYRDLMRRFPKPDGMPIHALHRAILDPNTNKLTPEAEALARELIFYRNRYMHDFRGAVALQKEQALPTAYQERVVGWIREQLACLAQYQLFQVIEQTPDTYEINVLMGDRIEGERQTLGTTQTLQTEHLYVAIPTSDTYFCLSPFIIKAPCKTHMRDEYFFCTKGFTKERPHYTGMHSDCVLDWEQEQGAAIKALQERLRTIKAWLID